MTAEKVIKYFGMKELPREGGWFVETYRAKEKIEKAALPARYSGTRDFGTAILYLLTADSVSIIHRLKTDEMFHFYLGDPVTMLQLCEDGKSRIVTLGSEILRGEKLQLLVPAGTWQGSFVSQGGKWALLGCTVAPGFQYADYEQADRGQLLKKYRRRKSLIIKLTQP